MSAGAYANGSALNVLFLQDIGAEHNHGLFTFQALLTLRLGQMSSL
jgi:hypothetical protein